ncbi:hypothetical protein pb186bvf_011628 [Paramecium bursaria]
MQLSQLERIKKITNNRFVVQDKLKQKYILTIWSYSEFNRGILNLNHPNMQTVIEYWEERGQWCILQEYLEMQNIIELCQNNKITDGMIIQITYQCCLVLQNMEYSQISGTLTLQNVQIDINNNVKVDILSIQQTPIPYASPEVLRKEKEGSDIWSLGIILFYLIKQQMPFSGDSDKKTAYNIIYKQPMVVDSTEYPLGHNMIKAIFTKNIKKRATPQVLIQFLQGKLTDIEIKRKQLDISKRNSLYSIDFQQSQIDFIDQSVFQIDEKAMAEEIPEEKRLSQHSRFMVRPQSSMAPVQPPPNLLFERIKKMRPNSAVGLTGKQFIANEIKKEINERRQIKSAVIHTDNPKSSARKQNTNKEVSVDLKEAYKVDYNNQFLRVYNFEHEGKQIKKNQTIYTKILKASSPKSNGSVPLIYREQSADWTKRFKQGY